MGHRACQTSPGVLLNSSSVVQIAARVATLETRAFLLQTRFPNSKCSHRGRWALQALRLGSLQELNWTAFISRWMHQGSVTTTRGAPFLNVRLFFLTRAEVR